MSCATAPDAEITRPATTARIVANATPAMIARNSSPPSSSASDRQREVAGRAGRLLAALAEDRAGAEAERRRHHVEGADQDHRPHHRAARRLGVRHREEAHQDVRQPGRAEHQRRGRARRCRAASTGTGPASGRPRRPPTSRGRRGTGRAGSSRSSPAPRSSSRLRPPISRNALMICTQLVASMPPATM